MRKLCRRRCLPITYMQGREEAGIVGYDGHFCAIIARLVEDSLLELYEYVWIFIESGVEVPVMVLRLWSGAMDPRGDPPTFLFDGRVNVG